MGFFSSIASVAGSVIKSPITKAAAGGLAIVFPPVGIPAAAAVVTANAALAYAESDMGKKVLGTADKLVAKKRMVAKVSLQASAQAAIRRGVPPAKAKAAMLRKARKLAPKLRRFPSGGAASQAVAQHRASLAAQLKRTAQLAAKGDPGARRALATFKVVAAARKGDPKAKAAVALIAHRWEVGQRVRSKFELTAHGRIRARARV